MWSDYRDVSPTYAEHMITRVTDGSAGDADYGEIGKVYTGFRNPDPRIAQAITTALGNAETVLNVGAGAGAYEPTDRTITAVEPSASMRALRPGDRPAIDATAEHLPFPDDTFDAAMATFTVHQWQDLPAGLTEVRRVTLGPVAILTCDPDLVRTFWLYDYAPEVLDVEAHRYPTISSLGGTAHPAARQACSAWSFVDQATHNRFAEHLARDLEDGTWERAHGRLRDQPTYNGSLVLVVAQ
jgi:SAM-dependent methyltransferase